MENILIEEEIFIREREVSQHREWLISTTNPMKIKYRRKEIKRLQSELKELYKKKNGN